MLNKDKGLTKFEIRAYKQKVEKILSSFSLHLILSEDDDIISNSKLIQNFKESSVLVIKYNENYQNKNFFIICFKNTILIIYQSLLKKYQTFFLNNPNLSIYFLNDTRNIFNSIINLKIEQYEIDDQFTGEIENFNNEIQTYKAPFFDKRICQSILSCTTGYLIQEGYTKANLRLDLCDQILKILRESEKQTELIGNCTIEDYVELRNLGFSQSSTVKLIYHLERRELFALKKPKDPKSYLNDREIRNLIENMPHPLISKYYGTTKDNNYLITSYFEGQELSDIEEKDKSGNKKLNLTNEDKILIIAQLMGIIEHLNYQKFIYRDLKPNNVIINHNKIAFLIDYDRMVKDTDIIQEDYIHTANLGFNFMAPEATEGNITVKCDVYSIGQMIYYIMNEKLPPEYWDKTPIFDQYPELYKIYHQCIELELDKRPLIETILREMGKNYLKSTYNYLLLNSKISENKIIFLCDKTVQRGIRNLAGGFINAKFVRPDYEKAINLYKLSSKYGDTESQYKLGCIYYEGKITPKNIDKSINYFLLAAIKNHIPSICYLGKIYKEEKHDLNDSIKYYLLAANLKSRDAQFILGSMYYDEVNKPDIEKAIYYLTLAADQKHLEALYKLGMIYYYDDKKRDIHKSIHYLEIASKYFYLEAQYQLGIFYFENKYIRRDIEKAIKYFTLASKQKHIKALYHLGVIYSEGIYGEPKDLNKSIYYFTLASELDHSKSQNKLGELYFKDKKDYNKAIYLYLKAANQGNAEAQLKLALIYLNGIYVKRDINKAIDYFQFAARSNSEAQYHLGKIYSDNKYVLKNIEKSIHLYTLSASQNNRYAQYDLGMIYLSDQFVNQYKYKGINLLILSSSNYYQEADFALGSIYQSLKFIKQDINKSIHYYKRASSFNNNYAKNNLGIIYKNGVEGIIQQNVVNAIIYFKEAIEQKNDPISMYNLANIYIFDEQMKNKIDEAIDLLINSSIQKFSNANGLLIIALIKKHGFDLTKIRQDLIERTPPSSELPEKICKMIFELFIDEKLIFESFCQKMKKVDYLYDHLHNHYVSKSLNNQNTSKYYIKENITQEFYEGFGRDLI